MVTYNPDLDTVKVRPERLVAARDRRYPKCTPIGNEADFTYSKPSGFHDLEAD